MIPLLRRLVPRWAAIAELHALGAATRGELPLECAPLRARPPRPAPARPRAQGAPPPAAAPVPDPVARLERLFLAAAELPNHIANTPVWVPAPRADEAARAARERWQAGRPLSSLDGVPVAVQEDIAALHLPRRMGARYLPAVLAQADAAVVARLRRAGAVIAFQTAMTEWGVSPLGVSAQQVLPQNPHAPAHAAGGAATGAAVAVATGLVPLALGTDGKGGVRVPAALCGVWGLKPTLGRLPATGAAPSGTMLHLGCLGATVADLAGFLAIAAGPDEGDPASAWAPADAAPPGPAAARPPDPQGIRRLRIGVPDALWQRCEPQVAERCTRALDRLAADGAERVKVDLPLCAHAPALAEVLFGLEVLAHVRALALHPGRMGADVRAALETWGAAPGDAYLDAARVRATLREEVRAAFRDPGLDLLALPTTACAAPVLSTTRATVDRRGALEPELAEGLLRFTALGSLTGLPALSAPVAPTDGGLPVGLQLIGDAWDEDTVLAAAAHLERCGAAGVRQPACRAVLS